MKDTLLVLQYLFNWKFLVLLSTITSLGLLLPDRHLKYFRSVRFNIYLFLVIAIASAVGTFLPQDKASAAVYHTWWFAGLLALMAFDVITCKLRRLPEMVFGRATSLRERAESPEHFFSRSKLRDHWTTKKSPEEAVASIQEWLGSHRFRFDKEDKSIGTAIYTGKHRIQRWGDFILHVSIVAVLAGNMMGAMFGFEEVLPIPEGKTISMKNRPFDVTLKDFTIDYYKGTGAPSVYASDLVVSEGPKVISETRIIVNYPLDIDRVRFYQASWGMTYDYHSARLLVAGREMELKPHVIVAIPGTPLSIRANDFLPSFNIDEHGHATTDNFEGKNPALQVDFLEKGKVSARVWLLKNSPHSAFRIMDDKLVEAPPPPFFLLDVDPVLFSGIQVRYDPGAPLFWTSSIVLLIGLCMHFYMHQRRLRILVSKKDGTTQVIVGGWNSRTPEEFQQEFANWMSGLRESVS